MRVIIAGAGIGGLVTALSLHEAGFQVKVYEAVRELKPLGVGINILPHAVRELTEMGLLPALENLSVKTAELIYHNKFGQRIWREPRGLEAGYRWPQFSIHRGELQMLLYRKTVETLGAAAVVTGRQLEGFENLPDGRVTARFIDRAGDRATDTDTGDLLIAADGIHSTVRGRFYPDEGPPKWGGVVMWRGTTEAAPFLGGRTMIMAGFFRQKFVCYPITPTTADGKSLLNWVAELRPGDSELSEREDWNKPGKLEDFLPAFESWRFDWLDVPALIRAARAVYVYPMVDRDPLPRWSFGRVTLLGDAAHPMYPIGSNGASQAILDARTLTGCLRSYADPEAALAAYEDERREATAQVVLANRELGPERVMQLAEDRAPGGFDHIHDVLSADELERTAGRYKRLAGFDRDTLNNRPSLAAARAL